MSLISASTEAIVLRSSIVRGVTGDRGVTGESSPDALDVDSLKVRAGGAASLLVLLVAVVQRPRTVDLGETIASIAIVWRTTIVSGSFSTATCCEMKPAEISRC